MRYILWKIKHLKQKDLQKIMGAIEKRYARDYPDWDVCYIALHKDPQLRQQELQRLTQLWLRVQ